MANAERGEAVIVVGRGTEQEKTYTLQFTFDALETIEQETGDSIEAVFSRLQDSEKRRLRDVRILVYAALKEHHPEVTMKLAGAMILAATTDQVMKALQRAAELAFPDAGEPAAGGAEENPTASPPGPNGTGTG